MKKFISILLILGLVATTLTGCITEVGGASDPLSYDTEQPDISEEDVASELDTEEPASDMNDETDSSDDISKWMESIDDSSWADDSDVSDTDDSDGSDDSSNSATTITEDDLPTVSEEVSEEETTVSENIGLNALAQVQSFVNVRTGPSTGYNVVGKIYNNCAATILDEVEGEEGNWYFITSGTVVGFIKAEFFVVGDEAQNKLAEVGLKTGVVTENSLRVRSTPDMSSLSNVFTTYAKGTEVVIEEITKDGWAKINTDDSSVGYVYAKYLDITVTFKTAISLKEEQEELARKAAAEEAARKAQEEYERRLAAQKAAEAEAARKASIAASVAAQKAYEEALRKQQEKAAAEKAASEAAAAEEKKAAEEARKKAEEEAASSTDSKTALRNAVVAYALQFVGNPYVHGGASLTNGTDCTGFTRLVYLKFGYSLSYTPERQQYEGQRIVLDLTKSPQSQLLPGDLIFFTSDVKPVGHVTMYIGNGQSIHAANEQLGIIISPAFYRTPLFAVRVIQ